MIGTTRRSEQVDHHNGHTTPSEGCRAYANPKQTLNLSYGGKRVAACVREAVVNGDVVAGSSRSYCYYFVSLRRAYNESTNA